VRKYFPCEPRMFTSPRVFEPQSWGSGIWLQCCLISGKDGEYQKLQFSQQLQQPPTHNSFVVFKTNSTHSSVKHIVFTSRKQKSCIFVVFETLSYPHSSSFTSEFSEQCRFVDAEFGEFNATTMGFLLFVSRACVTVCAFAAASLLKK